MGQARSGKALRIAVIIALFSAFARLSAQDAFQVSYEGTLGPSRIGLTLVLKANVITGGHYFYAKYLTDIPVTGALENGAITLKGQDGGTFALNFIGNGSEGGKPLDFNNSVGLKGAWTKDAKSLTVKLSAGGRSTLPSSGRWYEMITDGSDAAFEAKIQGFRKAALAGDKKTAANYVAFPLRINRNGKSRTIHTADELAAQWETIFTPAYLAVLDKDIPHDLSVSNGRVMLGAGDVWFDEKGATALNLP